MNFSRDLAPLLGTLHDPALPREEKQRIERALTEFRHQADALSQCQAVLDALMSPDAPPLGAATTQQYVAWHALSVVEYWAEFRAGGMPQADAERLRDWLLAHVSAAFGTSHRQQPAFLATKAAKCVIALARACWPRLLPSLLFDDVMGSGALSPSAALRVVALASEELCPAARSVATSASASASSASASSVLESRRAELRELMLSEAPRVIAALAAALSPVSGPAASAAVSDSGTLACLALECARAWFAWVPLELVLSPAQPSLLEAVFAWLRHDRGRCAAADCLCELLSRQYVPTGPGPRARLQDVFDQGSALVTALAAAPAQTLAALDDEGFLGKAAQLALLLLRNVRRVPAWAGARAFMAAFVQLTLAVPAVSVQLTCLEGWVGCLEDLLGWVHDDECDTASVGARLRDECADVIAFSQERALMLALRSSNGALLGSLDDQSPTDVSDESELGIYVSECLNVAGISAELLPEATLTRLAAAIAQAVDAAVTSAAAGSQPPPTVQACSDVATLMALAGRLSDLLVGENLAPRAEVARALLQRVVGAAEWANAVRLHATSDGHALAHARIIGSLPAWYRWLDEVLRSGAQGEAVAGDVCSRAACTCLALLDGSAPAPVALAAAQTFKLLCASVHSRALAALPQIGAALGAHAAFELLAAPARERTYAGLVCILALPTAGVPHAQQQWEARGARCSEFLGAGVVGPLAELARSQQPFHPASMERVIQRIGLLSAIAGVVRNEGTSAKGVVWTAVVPSLPAAVSLCTTYAHVPAILLRVLDYITDAFESFGAHVIGAQASSDTVGALVALIGRGAPDSAGDELPRVLASPGADPSLVSSICRVLDLLRVLCREGTFQQALLPGALWLAFDRVHAASKAAGWPHVSVQRSLIKLTAALLTHHQRELCDLRWFAPASEALLAALQGKDINAFRDATEALERLGANRRLFEQDVFRNQALLPMIHALMASVVGRLHELWRDESLVVLHGLAAVHWQAWFSQLLPAFISQMAGITQDQRSHLLTSFTQDTDLPTFSSNMCRLANDYNFFIRANDAGEF